MTDPNDTWRSEEIAAYINRRRAEDAARGHMDVIVEQHGEDDIPEPPTKLVILMTVGFSLAIAVGVIAGALAYGWAGP